MHSFISSMFSKSHWYYSEESGGKEREEEAETEYSPSKMFKS